MTGIELLYPVEWWDMMFRLGLAVFCGGVIGLEREVDEKPAGLRTHMLVSLGSAIFVMTAIQTGGVAAACGLWLMCLFSVTIAFLILHVAKRIESYISRRGRNSP